MQVFDDGARPAVADCYLEITHAFPVVRLDDPFLIVQNEPVGIIDMPPGERGYGGATYIKMKESVEEYNSKVDALQKSAGRLDPTEPVGKKLKPGAWKDEVK